ncbi:MAG: MBL fold metallo-hydrolase [Pseudonocardiaceae bacterium]
MFFQQFYLPSLGHASYLVGDEMTGRALVLDPRRDVDSYFTVARGKGLRIAYAVDTHGHNDYLSGLSELTARGKVEVLGSAYGELGYEHRAVRDGEVIEIGDVGVEVLHTPGHTPEHISLLIYDRSAGADHPALFLSGGAILVGDLARPDLLGDEEVTRQAAIQFCHTIQTKLLTLPDHVEIFPTHVAGSLCGGNIGSRLSTTIGYERRTNAVLAAVASKEEFVQECIRLDNLPAVPPYWKRMRGQNLAGPASLGVVGEPPALRPEEFAQAMEQGALVLDTRSPEAFGGAHLPGSLNAGLGNSFATWAGTIVPPDTPILLTVDDPTDVWEATWQLLRIGYDVPTGWLAGSLYTWRTQGRPLATLPQIMVPELKGRLEAGEINLLDVRQPHEWAAGHITKATFITGAELPSRINEVPEDKPLAVICGSGYRSSASASLLAAHDLVPVLNVLGGMSAWYALDYPTERHHPAGQARR